MSIKSIRVKNFRSLREVVLDVHALTVFVGCNDEGKSNVLRALDLFFSSDRLDGYKLDWGRDFCAIAKTPKNKAEQIEITLTFKLPSSFNVSEYIVWHRIWRKSGLHREEIKLASGNQLPSRSKAFVYLKSIRYDYVPAIKGPEYFQRLLASVHDMLDATVQKDIRTAAASFTTEIRKHTKGILAELEDQLGFKSDIELPSDLRQLFSDLEFRSDAGGHRVALSQRGDGIKVRHIPVILRWLADQANHLSAPGKPRVVTIWGYEEPENNLETRKCFELADFFVSTSDSIQTFLTTHSPVFYSEFTNISSDIGIIEVRLDQVNGTRLTPRSTTTQSDVNALHSSIGFLDLLEPHVQEWKRRIDLLEKRLAEGMDLKSPTIFVEGPTDKAILKAAITRFFPAHKHVKVVCSNNNGGGHGWVKDSLVAWQHSRGDSQAVGLFDADAGSEDSLKEFAEIVEKRANGNQRAVKHKMKPDGLALDVTKLGLRVPVAIEEICPAEAWEKATTDGWLEERPAMTALYGFMKTDISFNEWINGKVPDGVLRTVATRRVRVDCKERFAKYVANRLADDNCDFDFKPIKKLLQQLLDRIKEKNTA